MKTRESYKILAIIFLAGLAAPINQFKVPPMLHQLMDTLNISLAASGWLMTVFAVVGVVFALPAGRIIYKIGLRRSGIVALSTLLAGSILGGFSFNIYIMLLSRVIEGVGLCLISITGPAAISACFPPEKRGMPLGIWAVWVPFGTIISFTVAPLLGHWQNMWICASIYTMLILIVFYFFFRVQEAQNTCGAGEMNGKNTGIKAQYANKNIWLLAIIFMLFNMMSIAVKSYLPLFLEIEQGFLKAQASWITSLIMFFAMISSPITGFLLDRLRNTRQLLTFALLCLAVNASLLFCGFPFIVVLVVIQGVLSGIIPTSTFNMVPKLAKSPQLVGVSMSVVALGQNAGMCLGPVAYSYSAAYSSWQTAGFIIAGLVFCAMLLSLGIKMKTVQNG